ncbi:MAG: hypothetical protein Q8P13_02580 [bacterium]|nr:hypothetical protein [bacterium]
MNVWIVTQGRGARRFIERLAADESIHVNPAMERKGLETILKDPKLCAEMDALIIHGDVLVRATWVDPELIGQLKLLSFWKEKVEVILFFTNKRTESSLRRFASGFRFVAHPADPGDLYEQVKALAVRS